MSYPLKVLGVEEDAGCNSITVSLKYDLLINTVLSSSKINKTRGLRPTEVSDPGPFGSNPVLKVIGTWLGLG